MYKYPTDESSLSGAQRDAVAVFEKARRRRSMLQVSRRGPTEQMMRELREFLTEAGFDYSRFEQIILRNQPEARGAVRLIDQFDPSTLEERRIEFDSEVSQRLASLSTPFQDSSSLVFFDLPYYITVTDSDLDLAGTETTIRYEAQDSTVLTNLQLNRGHLDVLLHGTRDVDFYYMWTNPHLYEVSVPISTFVTAYGMLNTWVPGGPGPAMTWLRTGCNLTVSELWTDPPTLLSSETLYGPELYDETAWPLTFGWQRAALVANLFAPAVGALLVPAEATMGFDVHFRFDYGVSDGWDTAIFTDAPGDTFSNPQRSGIRNPLLWLGVNQV